MNAWVARFAPLVMHDESVTEPEIRTRIAALTRLRAEAPLLRMKLGDLSSPDDQTLADTFESAARQLDSLESDLRTALGKFAPGDPESRPDLDALRDRLAEREARQEVGAPTSVVPDVLKLRMSGGNVAAAVGGGVVGLGILGFIVVHAVLMIGGMMRAFGPLAFLLLGFYAIFLVGIGSMLKSAVNRAATEDIELSGRTLRVIRTLAGVPWVHTYVLAPGSRATSAEKMVQSTARHSIPTPVDVVELMDVSGRAVHIGEHSLEQQREDAVERINAYLKLQD